MRKVLFCLMVGLLAGSLWAKPKAKVEAPVQEEVKVEYTYGQLFDLIKQKFLPFKEVSPDGALYGFTPSGNPDYNYFWFVGINTDDLISQSIWGTYEYQVNPYKVEVRGCSSKESFLSSIWSYLSLSSELVSDNTAKEALKKSWDSPNYNNSQDHMSCFTFVWVFSDSYFVFFPRGFGGDNYSGAVGFFVDMKSDVKSGRVSEDFSYYNILNPTNKYPKPKQYTFDNFVMLLETRLKKEGTSEQLEQWVRIKEGMVSYFAE